MPRDHYSYTVYADSETARSFDERRFGGPIGERIARDQAQVLARFAGELSGQSVLDVGTGTGRAALQMARAGARVTGVDTSEEMLTVARRHAADERLALSFAVGDAHHLEFTERSFDVVVCLRVLMHAVDWRGVVAELCRVARHRVIVDYPSASSVAALQATIRQVTYRLGAHTEPYRVFSAGTVRSAFASSAFRVRSVHRQFVLPIALHKAIGSERFTARSEALLERLGLIHVVGTPVTVVAERCES